MKTRKVESAEQEKMRKELKDVRSTETVDLRSWPFPWLPGKYSSSFIKNETSAVSAAAVV